MFIKENIKRIEQELPANVTLVAATKGRSVEEIKQAVQAGIRIIGENYFQEAEKKYRELKGQVKFHYIGHLQKNKVKKAVEIFDIIQTVDSWEIAEEIDKRSNLIGKMMPVLIEINSGKEKNKSGCYPEEAQNIIKKISVLRNIRIKGLMTMAPFFEDPEKDRPFFKLTKELFDKINSLKMPNVHMEILSMGMSCSYKVATEEGANMIRIGTGIFGPR
jgi:pyridoxal phosphate enzyme (YggS family)